MNNNFTLVRRKLDWLCSGKMNVSILKLQQSYIKLSQTLIKYHFTVYLHYIKLVCIYVIPHRYHAMMGTEYPEFHLMSYLWQYLFNEFMFEPYFKVLQLY